MTRRELTIISALCSARLFWTIWLTHKNVKNKTLVERKTDAKAKKLTVALAATPAKVEAKIFADTIRDVADGTEVHTLAFTLPEVVV